jgi:hypothetical protein
MVDLVSIHSMLIEMHGGMLTLAIVCILATLVSRAQLRIQKTNEKNGILSPTDSFMGKIARYTEPTAYLAAIGGMIGLIASAIVGIYAWPINIITTSTLALNHIMFAVFALELWIIFVIVRSKYGENLWKNSGMASVYACLGIFGFLFVVLSGSLGAHMAIKGSVLDPVYALLGVNPVTFGVIGFDFVIVLVSVSVVAIIVPTAAVLFLQRRIKLKDSVKT